MRTAIVPVLRIIPLVVSCACASLAGGQWVGRPAPEIVIEDTVQGPDASELTLERLAGRVVYLEFWATWCKPCLASMPHLTQLAEEFGSRGVEFVLVTDQPRNTIETFLARESLPGIVALDTDRSLFTSFGVHGIPRSIVIGRDGVVAIEDHPMAVTEEMLAAVVADEREDLGATLKASVLSGALSEEEAMKVWQIMTSRSEGGKEVDGAKGDTNAASSKRDAMLPAPTTRQIRVLFQPEFLRRDLEGIRHALELDQTQMVVAEVLLGDYLEAFDLASSPLREAIARYERTSTDRWLTAALERARIDDADSAVESTRASLERIAESFAGKGEGGAADGDAKRAEWRAWSDRMIEVTARLERRLESIRERVSAELAELDREGATVTAGALVIMAEHLRAERVRLRSDMTDSLRAITTEGQRGDDDARFTAAMARIRIGHLLPRGRLGGESMDLWAALKESGLEQSVRLDAGQASLDERASWIARTLDERTEATLDRELAGLACETVREKIAAANGGSPFDVEGRRMNAATRPFAEAALREVDASVSVRDALLFLLDESSASIEETYPGSGLSDAYRDAALRRGFPSEMRRRWSEQALDAAAKMDDLADDSLQALSGVQADTDQELTRLRADAIDRRLERDPTLAREQIDARFGGEARKVQYGPELWLGINYEAFASVDDGTEGRLRGILTPEQLELLPARRRGSAKGGKPTGGKTKGGKKAGATNSAKSGGKTPP